MSKRNVLQDIYGFTPEQVAGLDRDEVHKLREKAKNVEHGREHLPERDVNEAEKPIIDYFNEHIKHVADLKEIAAVTGIEATKLEKMLGVLTKDHFLTHTTCNGADVWVTPHEIKMNYAIEPISPDCVLSNWSCSGNVTTRPAVKSM